MGSWFRGYQPRRHVLRQLGMLVGAGLALDTGIEAFDFSQDPHYYPSLPGDKAL